MKTTPHTPTPWKVQKARSLYATTPSWTVETEDGKNTPVSAILKETDAAFIVRAVNCHEELLKALQNCVLDLEREYITPDSDGYTLAPDSVYWEKMKLYKQAIAKTEGK